MRIWAFISQKGGVGKSLLSTQLAVYAASLDQRVIILDLDPQLYATAWHNIRGRGTSPGVADVQPNKLGAVIEGLRTSGAVDLLFLDTPSRADREMVAAISAADLVICPATTVGPDMAVMHNTVNVIKLSGAEGRAVGVVNRVTPGKGAVREYGEASELIERFGIRVAATYICERAAYKHAVTAGKGVTQIPKAKEAQDEIIALWGELNQTPPIALTTATEGARP